jgi:hypothetical protein
MGRKYSSTALVANQALGVDDHAAGIYALGGAAGAARAIQRKVVIGAESALVLQVSGHRFLPAFRPLRPKSQFPRNPSSATNS